MTDKTSANEACLLDAIRLELDDIVLKLRAEGEASTLRRSLLERAVALIKEKGRLVNRTVYGRKLRKN